MTRSTPAGRTATLSTNPTTPETGATAITTKGTSIGLAIEMSSPSGRVSKRARRAADRRLTAALNAEYGPWPEVKRGSFMDNPQMIRDRAKFLRGLADAGMRPKAHRREADRLEIAAAELEKPQ